MKRLILFALLAVAVALDAAAQNRSIDFDQEKSWEKVVKKAKKAKKLLFVDCYTSWCGPCNMLAKFVFTNDEVADFFNANFVNVKYDMEKDADGVMLRKQFAVKAYPTLVFVDPVSGEVVHRLVGGGQADWLLAAAKLALTPDNNLRGLTQRYAAGDRTPGLVRDYVAALYAAYQRSEAARVACEYLAPLPLDSLGTPENWKLFAWYVHDPLAPYWQRVLAERAQLYPLLGQKDVDSKLSADIVKAASELADWHPKKKQPFNEKRNEQLLRYLQQIDFVAAPAGLAYLYTAEYVRREDYRGLLDKMKEALSYNLFRDGEDLSYFLTNIRMLSATDKPLVEEGIRWIDEKCEQTPSFHDKLNLMLTQRILWLKLGNQEEAENAQKRAKEYKEAYKAGK